MYNLKKISQTIFFQFFFKDDFDQNLDEIESI